MTIRFEQPWWLLLALLALPMALSALATFSSMSPLRRWTAAILRAALFLLLAAMLAGATIVRPVDKLAVVVLVDVSGSVRAFAPDRRTPDGREETVLQHTIAQLRRITQGRGPDDLLGVVAFDGTATVVAAPTTGDALARNLDFQTIEGTDIAAAIRTAMLLFPADAARRLVLVSDGVQTQGDALAAAREAAAVSGTNGAARRVTPIDVAPVRYEAPREVLVESVDVPARAPAGAAITARITLISSTEAVGTLRLLAEGQPVPVNGQPAQRVALRPGRNVILATVPLGPGRIHRIEALFEPDAPAAGAPASDTLAANNRAEAFIVTPGIGSVLIVDGVGDAGESSPAAILARALRREDVRVQLAAPGGLPTDLLRMQAYDAVILDNIPADALGEVAQQTLVRYVTELGGGLVMVGGPDSFGAGGWKGTPVEPILPVRLDLPERLVVPSAAVVFVIDTSGSMGRGVMGSSRSQQDIANLGAATAIRAMDKTDLVGLIEFNSGYNVVFNLHRNEDPDRNASDALGLAPGGGTNMPPALAEAYRQLKGAQAQNKHIIVLSDGISRGRDQLAALADAIKADSIRISAIAVGDEVDADGMSILAERTGGEFYRVRDPNTLPRIFVKAVRVVRSPMIREQPFTPAVLAPSSAILEGVDTASMPPLNGLTLTQPRTGKDAAEAASVSYVLATADGEPVLAHWQAGLGQVAAFTSDAHRWAAPWLDWPGYARIWKQIVRAVARAPASRTSDLAVEFDGDQVRVRLEAVDERGAPREGLFVSGNLFAPDGTRTEVRLVQTGPGVYQGAVTSPSNASGNYVVTLSPRAGTSGAPSEPVVGGVVRPAGAEFRALRSDPALLERIAGVTGGRVLDLDSPQLNARVLFDRSGLHPQEARTPLWPWLIVWALVTMLLDVGTRRIAWDRLLSGRFGSSLRQRAARAVRDRSEQAARTLTGLRRTDEQRQQSEAASPAALGEEDAAALAAAARKRRREQRAAIADQAAAGPVRSDAPAPAQPASPPPAPQPAEGGGLLAAKRRARQQMEEDR